MFIQYITSLLVLIFSTWSSLSIERFFFFRFADRNQYWAMLANFFQIEKTITSVFYHRPESSVVLIRNFVNFILQVIFVFWPSHLTYHEDTPIFLTNQISNEGHSPACFLKRIKRSNITSPNLSWDSYLRILCTQFTFRGPEEKCKFWIKLLSYGFTDKLWGITEAYWIALTWIYVNDRNVDSFRSFENWQLSTDNETDQSLWFSLKPLRKPIQLTNPKN